MDILQHLVAWPTAVLILSVIFFFLFRDPISQAIARTKGISTKGIELAAEQIQPSATAVSSEVNQEAVERLIAAAGNSDSLNKNAESILADLKAQNLPVEGPSIKVLVRHLAATQLLLVFEQAHANIFGSQIRLLKTLNENRGEGKSAVYLHEYAVAAIAQIQEEWSVEKYYQYLIAYRFIERVGDNAQITDMGIEYLAWIARAGKTETKLL